VVGWVLRVIVAIVGAVTLYVTGALMLTKFKVPPPPEPDAADLRPVDLRYQCSVCGAEVTMTAAADDDPEPPRHCREDMVLVTPDPAES
jgi:hypothetical protein